MAMPPIKVTKRKREKKETEEEEEIACYKWHTYRTIH